MKLNKHQVLLFVVIFHFSKEYENFFSNFNGVNY